MIEKSIDAFFSKGDKVAVIKGEWGVGKTFFWNQYVNKQIESKLIPQIAYSYISLFGKTSLSDIKQSIFQSAKPISPISDVETSFDQSLEENSKIFNVLPWVRQNIDKAKGKAPLLSLLTKFSKDTPFINKYSRLIAALWNMEW